eukprot:TRINITY_DN1237_c0_g1_i2.p1 TRINITY_DN1237_c0_g1~~TRINITY_DN1237_c0_g1_i2.p1  ORF type:complete len:159 (-),score=27.63 TRINITY_DN1237_c0_g1_i2:130-606(-)
MGNSNSVGEQFPEAYTDGNIPRDWKKYSEPPTPYPVLLRKEDLTAKVIWVGMTMSEKLALVWGPFVGFGFGFFGGRHVGKTGVCGLAGAYFLGSTMLGAGALRSGRRLMGFEAPTAETAQSVILANQLLADYRRDKEESIARRRREDGVDHLDGPSKQ